MKIVHGRTEKYVCQYCNAILSDPSVKSRHITEKHTERPRLSCTKCPYKTKRPGDLRKHCLRVHDETIVIPRRARRTDVEIVVKLPVVTQELDNYNSAHVTCASPVMMAPTTAELAVQDRFIEQMSMFQSSCKTTWQDLPSFDWPNSQIDSSTNPSPISTSTSSTPADSNSIPFDSSDWFMGALGSLKSHLSAPTDPLSPVHWPAEWEAFTFGI